MREELIRIAKEVEEKTGIPTYLRSLENILLALNKTNNFWLIVRYSGEPLNLVAESLKYLAKNNYVLFDGDKIKLSTKGIEYISSNFILISFYKFPLISISLFFIFCICSFYFLFILFNIFFPLQVYLFCCPYITQAITGDIRAFLLPE